MFFSKSSTNRFRFQWNILRHTRFDVILPLNIIGNQLNHQINLQKQFTFKKISSCIHCVPIGIRNIFRYIFIHLKNKIRATNETVRPLEQACKTLLNCACSFLSKICSKQIRLAYPADVCCVMRLPSSTTSDTNSALSVQLDPCAILYIQCSVCVLCVLYCGVCHSRLLSLSLSMLHLIVVLCIL